MGPEHVPQCCSRHILLHHFTEDFPGLNTLSGIFTKTHTEAMACFSLQLTSVRQLLRWLWLLLKIQPSVVFFSSARIFTPAFQLKHTRSTRRRPSCLCLPAPSSLPCRSILGDGGGISAAGKRERKQENVSGFGQRGAALCACAPVCTRQVSPGEEDRATISAKNTVSTSPFQSDWTATSL